MKMSNVMKPTVLFLFILILAFGCSKKESFENDSHAFSSGIPCELVQESYEKHQADLQPYFSCLQNAFWQMRKDQVFLNSIQNGMNSLGPAEDYQIRFSSLCNLYNQGGGDLCAAMETALNSNGISIPGSGRLIDWANGFEMGGVFEPSGL